MAKEYGYGSAKAARDRFTLTKNKIMSMADFDPDQIEVAAESQIVPKRKATAGAKAGGAKRVRKAKSAETVPTQEEEEILESGLNEEVDHQTAKKGKAKGAKGAHKAKSAETVPAREEEEADLESGLDEEVDDQTAKKGKAKGAKGGRNSKDAKWANHKDHINALLADTPVKKE